MDEGIILRALGEVKAWRLVFGHKKGNESLVEDLEVVEMCLLGCLSDFILLQKENKELAGKVLDLEGKLVCFAKFMGLE